jgi:hypothetical protein
MREHYNNLSKIQTQDSKSKSQIETGYKYFLRYLYNQLLKASCKSGILRLTVFRYGLKI